jgi:RHS repeat-associated protein
VNTYDGRGRITASAFYSLGVSQWQTITSYSGMDQTNVTPPAGGAASAIVTNSLGETAKSMQYTDSSGDADTTTYTYTPQGQVASVADNNGNTWTYTYNLLGQELTATDPGTTAGVGSTQPGTTSYSYDPVGNMLASTDPNGTVLTYKYDALGRRIDEYNDTSGTPVLLGSWTYDKTPLNGGTSDALGYMSSGSSYDSSGAAYTESITGYNTAYEPTGSAMSIPSDQGALATGTSSNQYTTSTAYTPRTGLAEYTSYSADGGLPAETVYNTYDEAGMLTQFGDSNDYLDNVNYDPLGQVLSTTFGPFGTQMVQDYTYDAGTSRTLQSITNLQTLPVAADTTSYTYDPSGNITSSSDAQNTGGTQTQCYSYNKLDQLTAAWTDTGGTSLASGQPAGGLGGCANSSPSAGNIGGPAPYWESYTYDLLGDRTSETTYNTALPASQDTVANATTQQIQYPGGNLSNSPSSNAPATAQIQPDTAASIVTTSPSGTTTTTPSYNAAGQLTSQNVTKTAGGAPPAGPPSLSKVTYNSQGQVASVTTSSGTTNYTYDASGNLLIQASPSTTTLYVDAGAEEISLSAGTLSGVRLLPAPDGVTVAESSSGTDSYEVANQQGTAQESIQAGSLAISRRYFDPWGQQVGTPPAWPDSDAFLGKPQDANSGLVVLGARAYDPATGSFTSLDPLLEAGSPQQMGGYGYAADNPVTESDPSGKDPIASAIVSYLAAHPTPANNAALAAVNSIGYGGGGYTGGGASGGDGGGGWTGFINRTFNIKSDARSKDWKITYFMSGVGTVTIDVTVSVDIGTGESVMTWKFDDELKGDAEISLPGGRTATVPINVLPLEKEVAAEESCTNKCSLSGESKTVTLGGVPYNISENFGILSITFDVSSERPIKIAGTEVGGVNVDASITIQRLPNTRSAPPPGGPVGSLQMNEDHATNWIPVPSWQQIQTATASNSGAATAYAILAALAGGALYAWHRLRGGQGILEWAFG